MRDLRLISDNLVDGVLLRLTDKQWSELQKESGLDQEDRVFLDDLIVNYRVDVLTKQKKRNSREGKFEAHCRNVLKRVQKAVIQLGSDLACLDIEHTDFYDALCQVDDGTILELCDPLARDLGRFEDELSTLIKREAKLKRTDARTLRWIIRAIHRLWLVRTGIGIGTAKAGRTAGDPFRFTDRLFSFALEPVSRKITLSQVRDALNNHLRGYRTVTVVEAERELAEDRETARDNHDRYRYVLSRRKNVQA